MGTERNCFITTRLWVAVSSIIPPPSANTLVERTWGGGGRVPISPPVASTDTNFKSQPRLAFSDSTPAHFGVPQYSLLRKDACLGLKLVIYQWKWGYSFSCGVSLLVLLSCPFLGPHLGFLVGCWSAHSAPSLAHMKQKGNPGNSMLVMHWGPSQSFFSPPFSLMFYIKYPKLYLVERIGIKHFHLPIKECKTVQPLWKSKWLSLQKIKNRTATWSSNSSSGYIPKELKTVLKRYLYIHVHSIIHNH